PATSNASVRSKDARFRCGRAPRPNRGDHLDSSVSSEPELAQHSFQRVDRSRHGDVVALGDDRIADELDLEEAAVARLEELTQDANCRYVPVAGYEPLRRCNRADLEVADLHQPDDVDIPADGRCERAFGPARIQLHAHTGVEPAREIA